MKLEAYGITGPALTLLKNYLVDRQYVVAAAGSFSDCKTINQGVPQGSILGPLLFNIYINDLPNFLHRYNCLLYADDTTITLSDSSIVSLTDKLNAALIDVTEWCCRNNLIINPTKTKFMIFKSHHKVLGTLPELKLGSNQIVSCDCVQFLGIILDTNLKFTSHVDHIRKKMAFGIRALLKARPFFPIKALLSLYFAFIHSHINYGISAWGNTYHTHLSSIQHIQNQAIRIITSSPRHSSASPLLRENSVLSVTALFDYNLGIFFFKLLNNQLCFELLDAGTLVNHNTTRFALNNNLLLPKVNTNYGQQTFHFAAISLWNRLPLNIKSSHSITTFKKSLKILLLT